MLATTDNDDFVLEYDLYLASFTRSQAGESGTLMFYTYLDKGYSENHNPHFGGAFNLAQTNAATGEPFFQFGSTTYAYTPNMWYNIRIEYKDMSAATASASLYINGELVGTQSIAGFNSQTTSIASVEFFNSWTESNGAIYIDNLYLGRLTR
jgi:hypothetical protein